MEARFEIGTPEPIMSHSQQLLITDRVPGKTVVRLQNNLDTPRPTILHTAPYGISPRSATDSVSRVERTVYFGIVAIVDVLQFKRALYVATTQAPTTFHGATSTTPTKRISVVVVHHPPPPLPGGAEHATPATLGTKPEVAVLVAPAA